MTNFASFAIRRTAAAAMRKSNTNQTRNLVGSVTPINVDHYSSGWDKEMTDGMKAGKYQIQTFNKISPKVR